MPIEGAVCWSCLVGLFDECESPQTIDGDDEHFMPCGAAYQGIEDPQPSKGRGRDALRPDEVTDARSTGRKRAVMLAPILTGMRCEWAGLRSAGGGPVPIVGCEGNLIDDVKSQAQVRPPATHVGHIHHGPDKATLNNAVGTNLHRVCATCVSGESRLLMADLTWRRADEIRVGDRLWGFDEDLSKMRLKPAQVTSVSAVLEPSYRIHMKNGDTLVASHAHQWVASRPSDRHVKWFRTEQFLNQYQTRRSGHFALRKFLDPWEAERTYEAGWLAGFLDGEGHLGQTHLTASQTIDGDNVIPAQMMQDAFEKHAPGRVNYVWRSHGGKLKDALVLRITTLSGILETLGKVRPARLLAKVEKFVTGKRPIREGNIAEIEWIEDIGETEVFSIETTSATYIVEGYLSHNCHNRWHAANDEHYAKRQQANQPFLPVVPYYLHDTTSVATVAERELDEAWWATPKARRGAYPVVPTGPIQEPIDFGLDADLSEEIDSEHHNPFED